MACASSARRVRRSSGCGAVWRDCLNTPDRIARPRVGEWLVRQAVARSRYGDALLGDLHEGFAGIAAHSRGAASRRYWRRALSIALRFLPSRLRPSRHFNSANTGDSRMATSLNDLRFGFRALRRSPSFTIAAIVALGLGTGSAAGVFSLLRGVVLRPLPFDHPEQLVMLWETNTAKALEHEPISPVNFVDYRGLTTLFTDAAAWWRPQINLTDAGEPVRVNAIETTENLFSVLGVRPYLGRDFPIHPKLFGPE